MSEPTPPSSPLSDWVLADCPACSKTMKLRRNMVGKHALLCPSCKAPIAIDFGDPDPPEEPETPPPAETQPPAGRTSLPSRTSTPPTKQPVPISGTDSSSHLPKPRQPKASKFDTFKSTALPSSPLGGKPRTDSPPPTPTPLPNGTPAESTGTLPPPKLSPKAAFGDGLPAGPTAGKSRIPLESKGSDDFFGKLKVVASDALGKLKKRRKLGPGQLRLADWDTPGLDAIPQAEIRADEWAHRGPDMAPIPFLPGENSSGQELAETPPEDGSEFHSHRRKRSERRRVIKGMQMLFLRMSSTLRWTILILFLLVLGAAGLALVGSFQPKKIVTTISPPSEAKLQVKRKEAIDLLQDLTLVDLDESRKVVRKFLEADGVAAKAAFVRMPEKVRPLMEQWYITHPSSPLSSEDTELNRKAIVNNSIFIFLGVAVGQDRIVKYFTVEQIPNEDPEKQATYLVDWETSVGYQPMELRDYQIKQPKEPMLFRVLVKPDTYFNYGFNDKDQWLCYKLIYPGDPDFFLYGYVKKGTELAADMEQQLFREPNIVAKLRYPDDAISRDQVVIEKIAHPSWFYERPDVKPITSVAPIPKAEEPAPDSSANKAQK